MAENLPSQELPGPPQTTSLTQQPSTIPARQPLFSRISSLLPSRLSRKSQRQVSQILTRKGPLHFTVDRAVRLEGEVGEVIGEASERIEIDTSQNRASISPICSECKSIFDHWYDRDDWAAARPGHSHHHIVGLQESSRNGCSVCALFLRGLSGPAVNILIRDWPQFKSSVTVALPPYHRHIYIINLTFDLNTSRGDELKTSLHAFASGKFLLSPKQLG